MVEQLMKKVPYFLLALLLWSGLTSARHPFYLSVCDIYFNPQAQSLEVAVKIFTDDLEAAIEAQGSGSVGLGTAEEHPELPRFLERYLRQQLSFTVNGEPTAFAYLGKEAELDATWLYLEIPGVPQLADLQVENRLLFELFEDQRNPVHLTFEGETRSRLLDRREAAVSWQLAD